MSATTDIEWCDKTWNPVRGCSLCSPGCKNCYAMKQAHRFSGPGKAYEGLTRLGPNGPTWTGAVRCIPEALEQPLRWRKPVRIFVNSMSDLFHDGVPDAFIDRVFAVMALAPQHTFQVLTKRPERMRAYFRGLDEDPLSVLPPRISQQAVSILITKGDLRSLSLHEPAWPLPNVWVGVSVENQHFADERIPLLLDTPAAVRFISAEPLLGPIDVSRWLKAQGGGAGHCFDIDNEWWHEPGTCTGPICLGQCCGRGLDWVIPGGESGPGARPCALEWIESLVAQCQAAHTACFVKQLGAYVVSEQRTMPAGDVFSPAKLKLEHFATQSPDEVWAWRAGLRNRKGGDMAEWPADLRVREMPRKGELT